MARGGDGGEKNDANSMRSFERDKATKSLTNSSLAKKKVRKWACNATTTTVSFICMTITIHNCKSVESMIMTDSVIKVQLQQK